MKRAKIVFYAIDKYDDEQLWEREASFFSERGGWTWFSDIDDEGGPFPTLDEALEDFKKYAKTIDEIKPETIEWEKLQVIE